MKFKIDQNLPLEAAELLTAAGHDAMTVYQQSLGGAPDEHIVDVCKNEGRILITADLDLFENSRRGIIARKKEAGTVLRKNSIIEPDPFSNKTKRRTQST